MRAKEWLTSTMLGMFRNSTLHISYAAVSTPPPVMQFPITLMYGRQSMMYSDLAGFVSRIAVISLMSSGLLYPMNPVRGWLPRVIDAPFLYTYDATGSLFFVRNLELSMSSSSLSPFGTHL